MLCFDKAYTDYDQFARWTVKEIYFVTRQKSNALFEVEEPIFAQRGKNDTVRVTKEELITIVTKVKSGEQSLLLRRVCYQDEKNRKFVFLSNNMEIPAI